MRIFNALIAAAALLASCSAPSWTDEYDVVWTTQSENSSASMPLSGNSMGSNVWVEDNDLLLYLSTPGAREENGALLKLGRVRIETQPCIFEGATFEQKLHLADGAIYITTVSPTLGTSKIKLWSEIASPIVHIEMESDSEVEYIATYESWREKPLSLPEHKEGKRFMPHYERSIAYSNVVGADWDVQILNDNFRADSHQMLFYHRMNEEVNLWEQQMDQQELREIESQLFNPVNDLTFGGKMVGDLSYVGKSHGRYVMNDFVGYKYKTPKTKSTEIKIVAHVAQTPTLSEWEQQLDAKAKASASNKRLWEQNKAWWQEYWSRSHIIINSGKDESDEGWMVGRNYNLFRYMLASGYGADEPLMFNGGLFTFDPKFEGDAMYGRGGSPDGNAKSQYGDDVQQLSTYTPDFRRWGAAFTAQNQRLVYFPMIRSGDYDLLKVIFDWYLERLPNAEAITRHYNNIDGCMFNEQVNMIGITGMSEYGWANEFTEGTNKFRPLDYEKGITPNGIARIFISQLELSWFMLEYGKFSGEDISKYVEFIEQSVIFYDEYYRKWERSRSGEELLNGKLHLYPANALEGNTMADNPNCAINGLRAVIGGLLELDDSLVSSEKKGRFSSILATLPDFAMGVNNGKEYYKIAENKDIKLHKLAHSPQLYALYPFKQSGIGADDLDIFENTLEVMNGIDPTYSQQSRGWNHNTVHYALVGNTEVARRLVVDKIEDGPFRFPAFFPGGDYGPDHNVGGAGVIGLQEMILQSRNGEIRVLPTWPEEWDVEFKLHAPYEVVEGEYKGGKLLKLNATQNSAKTKLITNDK